jgi:hypothetical protein
MKYDAYPVLNPFDVQPKRCKRAPTACFITSPERDLKASDIGEGELDGKQVFMRDQQSDGAGEPELAGSEVE